MSAIDEQLRRAEEDERNAARALEDAENNHDDAVEYLKQVRLAADGKKASAAEADKAVERVRAWLAREVLVGLSKSEVALIERLIDDLGVAAVPVRRAA